MSTKTFTGRTRKRKTRRNVKAVDRLAQGLITVGGLGTILAVCGVCVVLVSVVVLLPLTIVALVASCALSRQAAAQVTATVPALATVHARTSLVVSSELLRFDVVEPGGRASVTVDFSAAARTAAGADVVLSVEPLTGLLGPGGAADVEATGPSRRFRLP